MISGSNNLQLRDKSKHGEWVVSSDIRPGVRAV